MSVSVFPVPVSSSGPSANAITAVSPNTLYEAIYDIPVGIYSITCVSTTIATVEFFSGQTTLLATGVTTSGVANVNLGTPADRIKVYTNTGSNIVVTIARTANALTNSFSGTLDTITTSGTYTGTSASGFGYVVLTGGGGGGGGQQRSSGAGAGAGGSLIPLTGSMAVTIGAAGQPGPGGGRFADGTPGGASTFAGITANGGGAGVGTYATAAGGTCTGAQINRTGGNGGTFQPGGSPVPPYIFVGTQPLGTGGTAGAPGVNGGSATGFGSGAGGGGSNSYPGAARPGVLYVLRF